MLPTKKIFQKIYLPILSFLFPSSTDSPPWETVTSLSLAPFVRYRPVQHTVGTHTIFAFKEPHIRELIWILKYRGKKQIGVVFGQVLAHQSEKFPEHDVVIPIPLSDSRLQERGFNQSNIIARTYAQCNPRRKALDNTSLIRIRNTEHQVGRSRTERQRNIQNAFHVANTAAIQNKKILLLDDVVTTGSTLAEARNTLLKAGAKQVHCVAIAH